MQKVSNKGFVEHGEAFSIATLIYARLRRVSGRLIDVIYLVENRTYAQYVVGLALATHDVELERQALRLSELLAREKEENLETFGALKGNIALIEEPALETKSSEPTEEDIYRAQVSHHYIGALR